MRTVSLLPATRSQFVLAGATIAIALGMVLAMGRIVPPGDLLFPIGVCGSLAVVAARFRARGEKGFVLCLKALILLVGFSAAFAMLTYVMAISARPWADARLAAIDAAVGLSAGDVVAWTAGHPTIDLLLKIVYFSLIPQTILVIVVLGFATDRRLDLFLVRFMLAALLTAVCFAFWPARGSCVQFGLPTPPHYEGVLRELYSLRAGVRTVTWRGAEGIITFPSFHAIWATLLTSAFWGRRWFWPIAALNGLVLISCVTTGMHYFVDVAAGLAISAVVIVATRGLCPATTAGCP